MAVQKTKQFQKACTKWKRKPAVDRATEAQARAHFKDVYKIYEEERDSFHKVGVANNAVMQKNGQVDGQNRADEACYGRQSS